MENKKKLYIVWTLDDDNEWQKHSVHLNYEDAEQEAYNNLGGFGDMKEVKLTTHYIEKQINEECFIG